MVKGLLNSFLFISICGFLFSVLFFFRFCRRNKAYVKKPFYEKRLKLLLFDLGKLYLFPLLFTLTSFFTSAQTPLGTVVGGGVTIEVPVNQAGTTKFRALIWLPKGYSENPNKKYPIHIFLHGSGEGNADQNVNRLLNQSLPKMLARGDFPNYSPYGIDSLTQDTVRWIIVAPMNTVAWGVHGSHVRWILPNLIQNYRIDTNQIHIGGISAGGEGSMSVAGLSGVDTTFGRNFCSILPLASTGNSSSAEAIRVYNKVKRYNIAFWQVGGTGDSWLASQYRYRDSIANRNPTAPNRLIVIQDGGHNSLTWEPPYRLSTTMFDGKNYWSRMLSYNKSSQNALPTANAGANQIIILPLNSVTLNGSATPGTGQTISNYQWSKLSGPGNPTIINFSSASTQVTGLLSGVYVFRLTVTNSASATAISDVQITVQDNPPSITSNNVVITLPASTANLTSIPTSNYSIQQQRWTKFKVPGQQLIKVVAIGSSTFAGNMLPNNAYNGVLNRTRRYYRQEGIADTIYNLAVGGTDIFSAPITNALNTGARVLILSYPSNGYGGTTTVSSIINAYQVIADSCISRNVEYYFFGTQPRNDYNTADRAKLVVINDSLRNRFGDRFIDVLTPVMNTVDNSIKEEYHAGDNIHLNETAHERLFQLVRAKNIFKNVTLSSSVITNSVAANTSVTNLIEGIHKFQVSIIDSRGLAASNVSIVTVNQGTSNQAPTANAGVNQSITLPTNAVTFNGSGSDPDGTIASYQWTKIAGPAQFNIVSASAAQTVVNNLVQGVYQFVLTVTDNQGATGRDTVVVTVNAAAPPPNQAPTANAGIDQNITLPTNTVNLNGSGTDPDGTIASYQWTKIAGPAQFNIVSASAAQTVVNNLVQGVYQFVLTVTDNQGATGRDTVVVTVNAAAPPPNQAPTANAGIDQNITLPTNTVNLNGSGTDPDGTIASYQWTKIAGPAQFVIVSPAFNQTVVNNLVQGVYQFVLTVTDNQGATGRDTVVVTVNAAPPPPPANQAPTANAGADQSITLPTNAVNLNGSGSDPDGTIASYQWTKIAGPAQFNIVSASAAQTVVNNLVQGVYQFVLTVTDNQGATGRDTVVVTVNAAVPPSSCSGRRLNIQPNQTVQGTLNSYYINGGGFLPGDTLVFTNSIHWGYIGLINVNGTSECPIVITNSSGGPVVMFSGIGLESCSNIKLLGTGSSNQYGFQLIGTNLDGTGIAITKKSKNIEISNVFINRKGWGFWIKNEASDMAAGCDTSFAHPYWVLDNISVHDCYIRNMSSQGFYMGSTDPNNIDRPIVCNGQTIHPLPTRLGNIKIYNNIVDSTGRPGIQLSAAQFGSNEIYNNMVTNSGLQFDNGQGAGIQLGTYTRAYVHHNTIKNTYTWGISSIGGSGLVRIEENNIDSTGYLGTNQLNWPSNIQIDTRPTIPIDSTIFWIKNNILGIHGSGTQNHISVGNQQNSIGVGNIICGNTIKETSNPALFYVAPGIQYSTICTAPSNLSPTANAGVNQSITLPTNAVTFNGSGSDPDGTIASYQWTKIAGPAQFNIVSASAAQTVVNNLVQGVYQFVLTVTDNQGATGRDTVVVTVNAAPPPPPPANQAPTANAGIDQNITLPTNTVNLNGSGTDPDGTIASYQWTKIAGPAQFNIVSASAAQTVVNNLVQGVYQFVLTVTDNQGATGRDTVVVTVNAAPPPINQAPAANAGSDKIITLPVNSVLISGNGTDPDGTIVSYRWTKISGPSQYTIVAPNQAQTEFTNLVQGVYEFELAVTDNQGAIARDVVRVTVEAEPQSISTAKIFPNPAVSIINIRIDAVTNANKTKITIVNMAGMIVFQKEVMRTQQVMVEQVDVSRFARGSYVITIGLDINNSMTLLFIKK